ncbi:MAG: TIGR02147 family protein [Alphaproteobacteria bacterium]|nr:TIGR02147 family protein [Alphaproteobacteria bacterium]
MASPNIFQYTSYRQYLRDWIAFKPARSCSRLARETGVARSMMAGIVHPDTTDRVRSRRLARERVAPCSGALRLDAEEADFFRLLVDFEDATSDADRQRAWARILGVRRFRDAFLLAEDQYRFFAEWYYPALFELVRCAGFQDDPTWIARHMLPRIKPSEAQKARTVLLDLGLLRYEADGRLSCVSDAVVDPPASDCRVRDLAVTERHRWLLQRAERALTELGPEDRFFGACTVRVSRRRMPEAKARLKRLMGEFMAWCDDAEEPGERVVQVDLQLFPLTGWTTDP